MPTLLVIGTSEVGMFEDGRQYLKIKYDLDVFVEEIPVQHLEECLDVVKEKMMTLTKTRTIDFVILWVLTFFAWKVQPLYIGRFWRNIFVPNPNFNLQDIPPLMTKIVEEVMQKNIRCKVILIIPTIKDFYSVNRKRILQGWGSQQQDYLLHHPSLNPISMREHSIFAYNKLNSLTSEEYIWPGKICLCSWPANKNNFYKRKSLFLKSELFKDGFHPNQEFLVSFMKKFCPIFRVNKEQLPYFPQQEGHSQKSFLPEEGDVHLEVENVQLSPTSEDIPPISQMKFEMNSKEEKKGYLKVENVQLSSTLEDTSPSTSQPPSVFSQLQNIQPTGPALPSNSFTTHTPLTFVEPQDSIIDPSPDHVLKAIVHNTLNMLLPPIPTVAQEEKMIDRFIRVIKDEQLINQAKRNLLTKEKMFSL